MKIGIISDIHGNSVALKTVLKDIQSQGAEKLLIAGDFTGYYYRPDEVFTELLGWQWEGVRGNHEAMLEKFIQKEENFMEKYRALYGHSLDVALKVLSKEQINLLISLPEKREIVIEGKRILLSHGAPWDQDEYIYPDAPEDVFKRIADTRYDLVILGHTHYPMIKQIGNTIILNPGSAGQPRDEGSNASWALLNTVTWEIYINRVRFDPEEVIRDAKQHNPDKHYLVDVLTRKQSEYAKKI